MKTTMVKRLDEIKIPSKYSKPNSEKLEKCRKYYRNHGQLDRDIIVDDEGFIRDGYVGYLVLKEFGIKETIVVCNSSMKPQSYKEKETIYVFGCHKPRVKEYCWRVSKGTRYIENLEVGHRVIVNTKHGNKVVTVTRIEKLDKPPVTGKIKKVVKCYSS